MKTRNDNAHNEKLCYHSSMHILVTGSSGTIGTRLCERLLESGHKVSGIDWLPNKWQPSVQAITHMCDLRDKNAIQSLRIESPEIMIHLAANARVYDLVTDPTRALDNVVTTFNMLEYAREKKISKCIFASSRECYGNINEEKITEDMVRVEHCESPYTASKIAGEAFVQSYSRCYGMETLIFRFSNVYGMYDDSERVVPLFIRRARDGDPLTIFGKEKCLDFTYIDDTVSGIMLGIEQISQVQGEAINLAFGEGTPILTVAQTVKTLLHSSSDIILKQPRTGEIIRYIANIDHAKKILGYHPQTSFKEGIEKSVRWYAEHTKQ